MPEESRWIGDSVGFEKSNLQRASAAVTAPVEEALADPHQKQALDYIVILSSSVQKMIGEDLSAALGLVDGLFVTGWRLMWTRRAFLRSAGAGFAASLMPRAALALERTDLVLREFHPAIRRHLCRRAPQRERGAHLHRAAARSRA